MALPRTDLFKIFGLVSLMCGLLLLDRSFANWRNDVRNFPDQNGTFLPPESDARPQTFFQHHRVLKVTAAAGVSLMLVSIVLLGKEPQSSPSEG